tara:strand:- start:243 stop:476 length:234 start_codon:yes stop_codon:yes gene_type:complete
MATKVNDSFTVREVSTHLDLEEYNDELGQSNKDHYDDIEYDAIIESINRGLTNINELNGRQLALINHELKDWRTIIS